MPDLSQQVQTKGAVSACAFFAAILLSLWSISLKAQNEPSKINPGTTFTIDSKTLKEPRKILIYHPEGSTLQSGKAYPVLYLLDADNHFDLLAAYSKYLSRWDVNAIPEMIVIAIENTNRNRDLTPTHALTDFFGKADTTASSWLKDSGGNDLFLQFIREELMPYVESHYKTLPLKIFAGHSFGGITAINCLLNYPQMFDVYLSISPSLWWDKEYLLKLAAKKLKKGALLNKTLFLSDGNEGSIGLPKYHGNVLTLDSLINQRQLVGLRYKYIPYPEEDHMTEPVKAYFDALRFIFKGWDFVITPDKVATTNASDFKNHYKQLSQRLGFNILPNEKGVNAWASHMMKEPKQFDNAVSLLEMNTQNYPTSSEAFTHLADAYVKTGEVKKAITAYQKAISLTPQQRTEELQAKLNELQKTK